MLLSSNCWHRRPSWRTELSDASELIEQAKEEIADIEQKLAAIDQQIKGMKQERKLFADFLTRKRTALDKATGTAKALRKN